MQNDDNAKLRNQKETARKEYDEPKTNTQPERFMNKLHEHKVTVHDCTW